MNSSPVVSFVIPIFQQELYVAEAVESALAQTLADIEVIAVDDGSTDRSAAIVEAIKDPRLTVLRRTNGGPSAALNDGMRRARGRFIALLGGDDVAEPDRVACQVAFADARKADLVFSIPTLIDGAGRTLSDATMHSIFRRPDDGEPHQIFRRLLIDGNFLCAPTCLFRRELLDTIGFFRNELVQLQDYDYWLRAAAEGKCFGIMQHRTTRYRRHADNLSGQAGDDAVMGELMGCLFRALAGAPSDLVAKAFPDVMPPGRLSALPIDRAMIAMMHPRSKSLGAALILHAFLAQESSIDIEGMPMNQLGMLVSSDNNNGFVLGLLRNDREDRMALERTYLAPSARDHGTDL